MPSIVTHHLFAKDVLYKLPKKEKERIELAKEHYLIFAQSFDNLFYYHFFLGPLGKHIRKCGTSFQKIKIDDYFINILEYIKHYKLENNSQVLAYLFGSLTHYALDNTCHPFIIYKSGDYKKHQNHNLKYRGLHNKFEVELDAYMYELKTKKKLYLQKIANSLLPKVSINQELRNIMQYTYLHTFNEKRMDQKYFSSVNTGNFILKYFVTDRMGIKKKIYQIGDKIIKKNERKYQYLSFYIKENNLSNLNTEHTCWNYPTDKNMISNESFLELYNKAMDKCLKYITACMKYINNEINLNILKKEIQDLNYATGLSWKDNKKLQYFEF